MPSPDTWTIRQKIIGVLLRQARLEAGKSLKECGQVLGLSSGAFSSIEHGKRAISLPELELVAYYLGVPLDHLLNHDAALSTPVDEDVPAEEVLALRHRIVGVLLRQARLDLDLSQSELADRVGLPKGRISQYEQGAKPVPLVELESLAEALEVPLAHFLDEGVGPVGERQQQEKEWQQFVELSPDMRAFVLEPANQSYLHLAMSLSDVPADGLRNIAASLLNITF
jgi:transcriptional regulator with XRE-family HTH domain